MVSKPTVLTHMGVVVRRDEDVGVVQFSTLFEEIEHSTPRIVHLPGGA